ncbi:MAG: DNA-binding PadR family transcriptional regulator/SAM-dependent methyltransferase [Patiriisocius sp.]|jgi:DNA-binding PadR family transcriptional regulator/SAM-dependent methyltransferase
MEKNNQPLSKEDKKVLRAKLFQQLEGFALISTCTALNSRGICESFSLNDKVSLTELREKHHANEGYLNVALRILCSQGWMQHEIVKSGEDRYYSINDKGLEMMEFKSYYEKAFEFYPVGIKMNNLLKNGFNDQEMAIFKQGLNNVINNWGLQETTASDHLKKQMINHMNGIVLGPILVSLGMNEFIGENKILKSHNDQNHWSILIEFLKNITWLNDSEQFTSLGEFFMKRAAAFGVTVSYLPTFINLEELIFVKGDLLWDREPNGPEIHVDRTMNVWGSGGAHDTYFKKLDQIIIEIFNKPIEEQPKGIADMGCGNGALLEHMYNTVKNHTKRGEQMDEHPLLIIGSDFNQAAIDVTRCNLKKAGIEAHIHFGDIGDPDSLAAVLQEEYQIHLGDILNIRSFLDHNRVYKKPEGYTNKKDGVSSGAYAFRGRRIPSGELEQNLVTHFESWKPYVKKHGLLLIELHSIAPEKTRDNLGKTAVIAYDSTHGYTDQYIVEHDVFIEMAGRAGLYPNKAVSSQFPSKDLTTVSINLLSENVT